MRSVLPKTAVDQKIEDFWGVNYTFKNTQEMNVTPNLKPFKTTYLLYYLFLFYS